MAITAKIADEMTLRLLNQSSKKFKKLAEDEFALRDQLDILSGQNLTCLQLDKLCAMVKVRIQKTP